VLLLGGALLGFLAGVLTGGSVHNVVARRLRWPLVAVVALALKEVGVRTPLGALQVAPWLFVLSLALLIGWTLWHLRTLPGVWLVTLGMSLNLLVVVANGGHMPVSPELAHQGPPQLAEQGVWGPYVLAGPGTLLPQLTDGIRLPGLIGRAFPQIYSAGDLVSLAGLTVTLFLATRPGGSSTLARAITTP
jgi:Family of unknown function (DUF5317)